MSAMKRFHVLIPEDDFEWITKLAEENILTVSNVIRDAISHYRTLHAEAVAMEGHQEARPKPYPKDNEPERIQERLMNLEWFVYQIIPFAQPFPNRTVMEMVEFAPGYILEKPEE